MFKLDHITHLAALCALHPIRKMGQGTWDWTKSKIAEEQGNSGGQEKEPVSIFRVCLQVELKRTLCTEFG